MSARWTTAELSARKRGAKPPVKKAQPEYKIQAAFVREMSMRYPDIMVFSDTAAHIGKTMCQQVRANKLQSEIAKDWPDVFIAQPSGIYAGMLMELKAKTPYKVDGVTLLKTKDDHTEKQAATMQRLRERGYYVPDFVWSVEMAMKEVVRYLNL